MEGGAKMGEDERDWRLNGELDLSERHGSLHALIDRIREPEMAHLSAAVPDHVVLTHDGHRLFAYAADRATIVAARAGIEAVLGQEGIDGELELTHWDDTCDEWVAPGSGETEPGGAQSGAGGPQSAVESRTMVASAGRMVREEFEQTMLDWAARLGLRCSIVEHPHLLSTQVAFTVTGSHRKIDEFSSGLAAEGRAMIRTETAVMLSPL
jgi:hypothetical protein